MIQTTHKHCRPATRQSPSMVCHVHGYQRDGVWWEPCMPSQRRRGPGRRGNRWVILMEETKFLAVTKQEAELIMDSFKVSNPLTRNIALKAAGLVLEFAADEEVRDAERLASTQRQADPEVVR